MSESVEHLKADVSGIIAYPRGSLENEYSQTEVTGAVRSLVGSGQQSKKKIIVIFNLWYVC